MNPNQAHFHQNPDNLAPGEVASGWAGFKNPFRGLKGLLGKRQARQTTQNSFSKARWCAKARWLLAIAVVGFVSLGSVFQFLALLSFGAAIVGFMENFSQRTFFDVGPVIGSNQSNNTVFDNRSSDFDEFDDGPFGYGFGSQGPGYYGAAGIRIDDDD
jgi:hypothetical protein